MMELGDIKFSYSKHRDEITKPIANVGHTA